MKERHVASVLRRLSGRIRKDKNGCWIWEGPPDSRGRGHLGVWDGQKQTTVHPHRLLYQSRFGLLPRSRWVRNTCGNKLCVNPAHHTDTPPPVGEMASGAKLSNDTVRRMRDVYRILKEEGVATKAMVGRLFGLDRKRAHEILTNKVYQGV